MTTNFHLLLAIIAAAAAASDASDNAKPNQSMLPTLSKYNFKSLTEFGLSEAGIHSTIWRETVLRAINFDDLNGGSCTSSPLDEWAYQQTRAMGRAAAESMQYVVDLPLLYKLFVDGSEQDEYFGPQGLETDDIINAHIKCENFWSEADGSHTYNTNDITLLGMHGSDLADKQNMLSTLAIATEGQNVPYQELMAMAEEADAFFESLPNGYNNPLLTMNAVAVPSERPYFGDMIVLGDGLVEALRSIGLGSEGPEYAHSHEFGHHMQFEIDVGLTMDDSASASRRIELMADALGTYYMRHEQGANLDDGRIIEAHDAAFAVGDCNTDHSGHHGTPRQRKCAAAWGSKFAKSDSDDGIISHPDFFRDQFDEALPYILALDCEYRSPSEIDASPPDVLPPNYGGEVDEEVCCNEFFGLCWDWAFRC